MVLPLDEHERIRRSYHVEHKSIRHITRETGHCRDAIRKALFDRPSKNQPQVSRSAIRSYFRTLSSTRRGITGAK